MDHDQLAAAFNRWMDEYVNDPKAFQSTRVAALKHAQERKAGEPLSYGDEAAATLRAYLND